MTDKSLVERLIRPEVRALKAYHVPDAAGLIKLDAMEDPYAWPAAIRDQWVACLREVDLNRYPDPQARKLRERLRSALGVPPPLALMLGNGSDELIQIIVTALARPGATILAPQPTFVMYEMIARALGLRFVGVPLGEDFALDRQAMLAAIKTHQPAAIFIAYPNNPTGNLFDRADIEAIVAAAPGLVVIDEAYHAFAGESFLSDAADHDNVLVLRTLSKQGLAGLRLGILAGASTWIDEFDKVRLPYNLGVLAQASALFALEHLGVMSSQMEQIRKDREALYQSLTGLDGLTVWPSRTNFLLFRCDQRPAGEIFERLREAGILIKNLDSAGDAHGSASAARGRTPGAAGMLTGCLRVTVGTPQENAAFLSALENAL